MWLNRIGVVGAGLMSAEIAPVFALGSPQVRLAGADRRALVRAVARIEKTEAAQGAIAQTFKLTEFEDCEVVAEASLCLQAQEIMQEAAASVSGPRPLLKQRVQAGLVGGPGRPGWRN